MFKNCHIYVTDEKQAGRLSTSTTKENIVQARAMILDN
jgi:hypothetical protein